MKVPKPSRLGTLIEHGEGPVFRERDEVPRPSMPVRVSARVHRRPEPTTPVADTERAERLIAAVVSARARYRSRGGRPDDRIAVLDGIIAARAGGVSTGALRAELRCSNSFIVEAAADIERIGREHAGEVGHRLDAVSAAVAARPELGTGIRDDDFELTMAHAYELASASQVAIAAGLPRDIVEYRVRRIGKKARPYRKATST